MTPAEFAALPDGTVVKLVTNIHNPLWDKRVTRDWRRMTTIPFGSTFVVEKSNFYGIPQIRLNPLHHPVHHYLLFSEAGESLDQGVISSHLGNLVRDNLIVTERTLKSVLRSLDSGANAPFVILQELLDSHKITLDDVEEAYKTWYARPN